MEIILLIVLAAVWAMFLFPSFFQSRREAPINSTQDFARNAARLNTVRAMATVPAIARRRQVLARRRRVLFGLTLLAITTLAVAIFTGSVYLLAVNLVVDVLLAAYIAALVQLNQQAQPQFEAMEFPMDTGEQAEVRLLVG